SRRTPLQSGTTGPKQLQVHATTDYASRCVPLRRAVIPASCDSRPGARLPHRAPVAPVTDLRSENPGCRRSHSRAPAPRARHARPMSRWVLALLIVVAATARAAPGPVATIQQLPVLGTVAHGRARIVVRGEVSRARARDAVALVDQVVGD